MKTILAQRYWFIRLKLLLIIVVGRSLFDLGSLLKGAAVTLLLLSFLSPADALLYGIIVHVLHVFYLVCCKHASYWELLFTRASGLKIMQRCLALHAQQPAAALSQFKTYLQTDDLDITLWLDKQLEADPKTGFAQLSQALKLLSMRSLMQSDEDEPSAEMQAQHDELEQVWLQQLQPAQSDPVATESA